MAVIAPIDFTRHGELLAEMLAQNTCDVLGAEPFAAVQAVKHCVNELLRLFLPKLRIKPS